MFQKKDTTIERRAFLLSLCVHLLLLRFLAFHFPVQSVAHKPTFYFLGSLLESQDITNFSVYNRGEHKSALDSKLTLQEQPSIFDTTETMAVPKPVYYNSIISQQKGLKKTTFDEPNPMQYNRKKFADDMGIPSLIPKHIPLRL